jgi:hypothetical protein
MRWYRSSLVPLHIDLLPENQSRHGLLRALAERLSLLWSVDAAEPDLVLLAVGIEHGDRVAVRHAHHGAGQRFRQRADADISSIAGNTRFLI